MEIEQQTSYDNDNENEDLIYQQIYNEQFQIEDQPKKERKSISSQKKSNEKMKKLNQNTSKDQDQNKKQRLKKKRDLVSNESENFQKQSIEQEKDNQSMEIEESHSIQSSIKKKTKLKKFKEAKVQKEPKPEKIKGPSAKEKKIQINNERADKIFEELKLQGVGQEEEDEKDFENQEKRDWDLMEPYQKQKNKKNELKIKNKFFQDLTLKNEIYDNQEKQELSQQNLIINRKQNQKKSLSKFLKNATDFDKSVEKKPESDKKPINIQNIIQRIENDSEFEIDLVKNSSGKKSNYSKEKNETKWEKQIKLFKNQPQKKIDIIYAKQTDYEDILKQNKNDNLLSNEELVSNQDEEEQEKKQEQSQQQESQNDEKQKDEKSFVNEDDLSNEFQDDGQEFQESKDQQSEKYNQLMQLDADSDEIQQDDDEEEQDEEEDDENQEQDQHQDQEQEQSQQQELNQYNSNDYQEDEYELNNDQNQRKTRLKKIKMVQQIQEEEKIKKQKLKEQKRIQKQQEYVRRQELLNKDPNVKGLFEMEADLGSDNEENDHVIKNISESNEESDLDNNLEELIDDQINQEDLEDNQQQAFDLFREEMFQKDKQQLQQVLQGRYRKNGQYHDQEKQKQKLIQERIQQLEKMQNIYENDEQNDGQDIEKNKFEIEETDFIILKKMKVETKKIVDQDHFEPAIYNLITNQNQKKQQLQNQINSFTQMGDNKKNISIFNGSINKQVINEYGEVGGVIKLDKNQKQNYNTNLNKLFQNNIQDDKVKKSPKKNFIFAYKKN